MPELSHIDPRSAALLVMDYQVDTLTKFMTAAQSADAIACVPDLIAMAREGKPIVVKPASARSLAPTWRRCCAPTASVRDCCADPDAEVHAMPLDIVIAKQAAVVTTALAGALPGRSS